MSGVKHSVVSVLPDNPAKEVSHDAWNAVHTIDDGSITASKLDYLQHAPDYVIKKIGSDYVADGGKTNTSLSDSSLSDLWDAIYGQVSSPVMEFGRGTFTVDDSLTIQGIDTVVKGQGPEATWFQLGNSVNKNMISQTTYYHNTVIRDLSLLGNRSNNTSGKGIYFDVNPATYGGGSEYRGWFNIDNVFITECDEAGVYIRTVAGLHTESNLSNFKIYDNDGGTNGHQVEYIRVFDSFIGFGSRINSVSSMRFTNGCASNHIGNIYVGGGIDNLVWMNGASSGYPTQGNIFTNCRFDNAAGTALRMDEYNYRNWFVGCQFTHLNQGVADNTKSCIYADDNAMYNHFYSCWMGHFNISTAHRWKYAYEEGGSSDYNFLTDCYTGYGIPPTVGGNVEHFATDEYNKAANSKITDCYKDNGNAWNT